MLIKKEKLDKIRQTIIDFGDGLCKFETKDIEELLMSYEEIQRELRQQRSNQRQYGPWGL